MKSQSILLLLASLAILARDVACENENEKDENEKDENEKDENEGGGHKKILSDMALNGIAMSSSTSWAASSNVAPSATASWPTSIPTGAASVLASVASDASVIKSSAAVAISSWAASAGAIHSGASMPSGSIPAATRFASSGASAAPLPSISAARPYAGPSVISSSNRIEVSVAIATIGICAFFLTLA